MGFEPTNRLLRTWFRRGTPTGQRVRDRRGGTAIEYAMIVSLMTIAMLGAAYQLYYAVADMWNGIAAAMP